MSFITNYTYDRMRATLDRLSADDIKKGVPEGEALRPDENARLNVLLLGDPQVSNYMPARQRVFTIAARDIGRAEGRYDVAAIAGDITENGFISEFRLTADILNSISDKVDNFICVTGNHDIRCRLYHRQKYVFRKFMESVKGGIVPDGKKYYCVRDIKGYRFIMMGSDCTTLEAAHISAKQLKMLDEDIAAAEGRPVFVINHQALKLTNGLPDAWQTKGDGRGSIGRQSDRVRAVFEKHKNVYFITGHLHAGANEYTCEDYGSFKAVTVPTCAANNHGTYNKMPQFLVMTVYEDRIVIRNRLSDENRYTEKEHPGGYTVFNID